MLGPNEGTFGLVIFTVERVTNGTGTSGMQIQDTDNRLASGMRPPFIGAGRVAPQLPRDCLDNLLP